MDKPTNYKRKTPCANTRQWLKDEQVVTVFCRCCGEWTLRSGKPVRFVEGR